MTDIALRFIAFWLRVCIKKKRTIAKPMDPYAGKYIGLVNINLNQTINQALTAFITVLGVLIKIQNALRFN
ncbi:hypothetical protein MF1_06030 [Bartonella quintana]|nr:hypothetical protein MF1_06030 [Bartonella quintana]